MNQSTYLSIGGYYPMDGEGHVLNRTDRAHLKGDWGKLADAVVEAYRANCGDSLVGVYLRGSVAAGSAVDGISDFDGFAILKWVEGDPFVRWEEPEWTKEIAKGLQAQFPVASKVEMAVCSWKGGDFGDSPKVRDLIATQSLCLWGRDLVPELPSPHISQMKRNAQWIGEDWEAFLKSEDGEMEEAARGFIKTLIRGMFEEVMEKEGKYATDFHPCIEVIANWNPEWKGPLQTLVHIFVSPEGQKEALKETAKPLMEAFLRP